ncbi:hypothetical protein KAR91_25320 [Candidatus Pacearchaeota archaeon]|nr:hypothetical protein [Candidatus Pacearchaeota archaeon]
MNTQEYVKIGSTVKYLRHDTELTVHKGSGVVRAIFVDQDDRLMVQVLEGGDKQSARNVHYATLCEEHSDEAVKKYDELLKNIRTTSDEGDALVTEVVDKYNGQVQDLTTGLFGEPVDFSPSLEDEGEPENAHDALS